MRSNLHGSAHAAQQSARLPSCAAGAGAEAEANIEARRRHAPKRLPQIQFLKIPPEATMEREQFVYAIIKDDGTPVAATLSREHAFQMCKKLAGAPVSFSTWHEGATSRVTHGGEVCYRIHCLELKS
jgi:hypothetical protein